MIHKFFLASVGAIALTGSAALAAEPPPVYLPPPPIFTWTGIYVGGQIGYAWASGANRVSGVDPFTGIAFNSSIGQTPNGVIGGANVGYSYQIPGWSGFRRQAWSSVLKAPLTEPADQHRCFGLPRWYGSDGAHER